MESYNNPERPFLEFNYPSPMDASYQNQYASNYYSNPLHQDQELFQAQNDVNRLSNVVFQLESRIEELENEVSDLNKQLEQKQVEIKRLKMLPAQEVRLATETRKEKKEQTSLLSKPSYFEPNTCL